MDGNVALPPPKRPDSSRQVAVEIAPRRPDSSRRGGKRRSPSRQQKDLVNPPHGSNDPAPVAGAVASGPGQFRNYQSDTRYLESDPLRHGLDTKQVAATPFAMGPKSNPNSQTSSFRTLDISKANEGRQNWTRIDTFLTPSGHAHDDDFGRSPQGRRPTSRSRNEASAKSLAQDVFITELAEKFSELRRQIQEDTQNMLQPMQKDLDNEISKTKEMVQTMRSDNQRTVEEIRRLRSMEQHKQMLQAYPTPIDKDVFETEIRRVTDTIEALGEVVASVKEEVSAIKDSTDHPTPSRGVSFRRGQTVADSSHLGLPVPAQMDETLQSIRAVLAEMDFTDMLEEIKSAIPAHEFRSALIMVQEQMAEVLRHLSAIQAEVQSQPRELDFTPVLEAFANSPLHHDVLEVKSSLEETKAGMARNTEHLSALWSQLPPVDFTPVFDCIRANRVDVDLSAVLTAIEGVNVKEDMQQQFVEILSDIHHRQSHLDFSELLESIKATKLKVDFAGVVERINDSSDELGNQIQSLKPLLSNLEQSNSTMTERLQELYQVQDKGVLTGLASLKDVTERLSQKFSILLQTMSEKEDQEVKVNFTPVLEAIDRNKVQIDFSPILASIKKNCDFSEITEDVGRMLKTLQDMKVQVDFTPVLRSVRECKQETVFELLSAFRDQCTDTGELNDNLVQLREATGQNLKQLKDSMEKESKEALTSEVLRAIREKEVRIELEIKKALEQNNSLAEKGAADIQADVHALEGRLTEALHRSEAQGTAEMQKMHSALEAVEVRPQVRVDLTAVSKLVEDLHVKMDHIEEIHSALSHTLEEQAHGQDHLHETLGEVSEASLRQSESLKTCIREKFENVMQILQEDAKMESSKEQLNQVRTIAQAIQQRPTTEELDYRLGTMLESMQDLKQQLQQQELQQPVDFKREISDAMEAAALDQQKEATHSFEALLREQMQRTKKDLQSALEDQRSKDQKDFQSSLEVIQRQQEILLAKLQDQQPETLQAFEEHLQSSMAQVLSEIRSQQSGVDMSPILNSLRETQELTQGLGSTLRALRASDAGASGGGEVNTVAVPVAVPEMNWEWQQVVSQALGEHLKQQSQQLQQILGDRLVVDATQLTRAMNQDRGDLQVTIREMQDQLRLRELQQNPSSPLNNSISLRRPSGNLQESPSMVTDREQREILAAIRELQRNLDLSHEFSAVLAAIQEKEVKHTPVLVALQEQKSDINAQLDDLKEMFRQGGGGGADRPRTARSIRPFSPKDKGDAAAPDPEGFKLSKILDAIREQKVSIDFSVAQVLNNIQQKQQETIDKLVLTDQQIDLLKQGLSKLNGQDMVARARTTLPPPTPASPTRKDWPLPGSPWIPPGILGLEK